jgi:predicted MFS family arabinose efflux permease
LLLFALDSIGIAFAPTLEIAMALRIFGGIASAIIVPNVFALVADAMPRDRHTRAMGAVMLGMTVGIATGPAIAGLLTSWVDWRAPFVLISVGCLVAFFIGIAVIPSRCPRASPDRIRAMRWLCSWTVLRPLVAKGLWNGIGVAAYLLSGEVLRLRYSLDVAQVGLSAAVFGVGLAVGNLSAGTLHRLGSNEERGLVIATTILIASVVMFYLIPLPLPGALVCLAT